MPCCRHLVLIVVVVAVARQFVMSQDSGNIRSFEIVNDTFVKDGQKLQIISGRSAQTVILSSLHPSIVPVLMLLLSSQLPLL